MKKWRYIILIICSLLVLDLQARTTRLYGYVVDEQNVGIEAASVYLDDGITGTSTNKNGYYSLLVHTEDTLWVNFSMVGYKTLRQQLITDQDVFNLNVELLTDEQWLEVLEVRGIKKQLGLMESTSADVVRLMPDATGGSIESLLITFAGVNQNNELSTQYNVRGGSFDENSVYVNGIEVHRPLLIRSGQQEGLSFVNPNMVEQVDFSAGGFDACYGDKMASVLDIRYKRPERFESNISVSLLGANAYVGWGDSAHSQMHGIRYKTSKYMLGALPATGNYQPNFVDYQTQMTRLLGRTSSRQWELSVLGNFSMNDYRFLPESESESFGGTTHAVNKTIYYDGQERDRFLTAFAAIGAKGKVSDEVTLGFYVNGFFTHEQETFDIRSEYVLSEQDPDGKNRSDTPRGALINGEVDNGGVLGTGIYHEHARNTLQAGVLSLDHEGEWKRGANRMKWGVNVQGEWITDKISEWEWRDSMGYSMPNTASTMELFYTMKGQNTMSSLRSQAYLQDSYKWQTDNGSVTLTGGVRLNWWSFTNEVLCSPRASVVWLPGWKRDVTFRLATGLYYQAPFYKELRDTVTEDGVTRILLNHDLKAQRSVHLVLGSDYYFRAWGRPFKFTVEAYGKYIDRMVSYTVDNVRVRYSGKNDSEGYTVGVDFKLYGELVPGADSWISFSAMRSRMRFVEDTYHLGWIPSPQEQRYALTVFFQDYIPKFPQYKLHLKFAFQDGLPFGYPRNEKMRYLAHMPMYKRIDLGASRTFSAATDKFMRKPSAKHVAAWSIYFEVFNLVNWKNVNAYYWVTAADGMNWASPNYLTGRMYNLRLSVDLK